jgi:hypothetical protein
VTVELREPRSPRRYVRVRKAIPNRSVGLVSQQGQIGATDRSRGLPVLSSGGFAALKRAGETSLAMHNQRCEKMGMSGSAARASNAATDWLRLLPGAVVNRKVVGSKSTRGVKFLRFELSPPSG